MSRGRDGDAPTVGWLEEKRRGKGEERLEEGDGEEKRCRRRRS